MADVIQHGRALDAPLRAQVVADEFHASHFIYLLAGYSGIRSLAGALAHSQIGCAIESVDLLVVHAWEVRAQYVVDAPIA